MNNIKYSEFVNTLTKDGALILSELTPEDADLIHMVLGISGKAGELLDAVKKRVIYRKELDLENIVEELGDLEFYMERLRQSLNLNRDVIIEMNMKKLSVRYAAGYTDKQAHDRIDKEK